MVAVGTERAQETPRRRRSKWLPLLAGFFAILLVGELGMRVIANRLPEPLEYHILQAQELVHDMDRLHAAHRRSDLVMVGTSMTGRGMLPNTFEHHIPDVNWANNLALPAGQTTLQERWVLEEVEPRLKPRRVVWGISSLDFNGGRVTKPIDFYNRARATRPGLLGDADRFLSDHFALVKHRAELRDPLLLGHVLTGQNLRKPAPHRPLSEIGTWHHGDKPVTPAQLARDKAAHLVSIKAHQLRDFKIGTKEMAAFKHTLDQLKRDGVDVAVVLMPVTTGYLSAHPHGTADFNRWKRTVTKVLAGRSVPTLDFTRTMPDSKFRDQEHLFLPAAKVFSARVAERLQKLGW